MNDKWKDIFPSARRKEKDSTFMLSSTFHEWEISDFGGASKEQVSRVLFQLFPGLAKSDKYDATDALAISLCGLWQNPSLLKGNI